MTRPIKRGYPHPDGVSRATLQSQPEVPWDEFKKRLEIEIPEEENYLLREYYGIRCALRRGERRAHDDMGRWEKTVEREKGEGFFTTAADRIRVIKEATTNHSSGKERRNI